MNNTEEEKLHGDDRMQIHNCIIMEDATLELHTNINEIIINSSFINMHSFQFYGIFYNIHFMLN